MARSGDDDFYLGNFMDNSEASIFLDMCGYDSDMMRDEMMQLLFHSAMFDMSLSGEQREIIYGAMVEYVIEEYDLDFDSIFDWEAYREWYGVS